MKTILTLLLVTLLAACSGSKNTRLYGLNLSPAGYGVIVTELNTDNGNEIMQPQFEIRPGIAGTVSQPDWVSLLWLKSKKLPDKLEIVWQLAELHDCKHIYKTRKRGCRWVPIDAAIFRQELDMEAIKNSKEFQRAGTRNPNRAGSYFLSNMLFVFKDDHVEVEIYNSSTNPYM
ncbi:hypothetical protein ACFSJ3_15130 [Corallincola platygyrae]|uniref:Lipoprotein n=1 Tax=Corallincola platygyrae TaxID=1193278 RepID=A0ABW4XQ99_9GAMM